MQNHKLRSDLREAYDQHAQERDQSPMQEWKIKERARFLSLLQNEDKRKLLEIGAGTGRDSRYFQDQGFEVVCIDLSPVMVELCRQKNLTAYLMDMSHIVFPENSFDAVYSMNSLLHLTKEEFPETLLQINSLLKRKGVIYIGIYGGFDHEGIWEKDSYTPKRFFSFYSDENLEKEVSKAFDILTFHRVFFEADDPIHFQSLVLRKRSS